MKSWTRLATFVLTLLALISVISCDSSSDSDKIAETLADTLTGALNFENGSVVEGAAPLEQTGADAPTIAEVQSDELRLGAAFTMRVLTEFATPETIAHVLVAVDGASSYIQVSASVLSGVVDLFGQLAATESLKGQSFTVKFALQTADGVTGPYQSLNLSVADKEAQTSTASGDDILSALEATDSYTVKSGRPEGQSGAEAPQVVNIESMDEVYTDKEFYASLQTDFTNQESIEAILISTPNSNSYFEFPASVYDGWGSFHTYLRGDNLTAGDQFVLLFAFKAGDAVGLFRPYTFTVAEPYETDGDTSDGDTTDGDVINHCPTPQSINMNSMSDTILQAFVIYDYEGQACSYSTAYTDNVVIVFDCLQTDGVYAGSFSVDSPWAVESISMGEQNEGWGGTFTPEQTDPDTNIDIAIINSENNNKIAMTVAYDCSSMILWLNAISFQ